MWWLAWVTAAMALTVEVVPTEGPLHQGVPARVLVAVVGEVMDVPEEAPRVEVERGLVRYEGPAGRGVWSYLVLPPASDASAVFAVEALGRTTTRRVPLVARSASALEVPRRVDAVAGAGPVTLRVTGEGLPPPEALQVELAAGEVREIRAVAGALEVTLDPGDSPYPRFVPIGLRDMRTNDAPAWTGLRVRTRPRLALQTEPGTTLSLSVGTRTYGPFVADEEGVVAGTIEQYPGELVATAALRDALGNEASASLPLSSHTEPTLVGLASGHMLPGRPPPVLWIRGYHGDGHPWQGRAPHCRTASEGDLPLDALGGGMWRLSLLDVRVEQGAGLRVQCTLGGAVETVFRVPSGEGIASRIRLRVWPDDLSTDFPVAEIQASVDDPRGEPLLVQGLTLEADRGAVRMDRGGTLVARGEYDGTAAIEAGEDRVRARWDAPAGDGPTGRVVVGHGPVPLDGPVVVHGRVLDIGGRPLPGERVWLSAGVDAVEAVSGSDGWASASVPLPPDLRVVRVEARTAHRVAGGVALVGAPSVGGPGTPDLVEEHVVRVAAGRATDLRVEVDPPVLYTGPSSFAKIRVTVRDRAGNALPNAVLRLEVSEGSLGPLRPGEDGSQVAEYTPPPGDRRREIEIVARYDASTSSTRMLLEPRPVKRAVGIAFGATTNFGAITSPYVAIDLDWRLPWLNESLMFRAGFATYGDRTSVSTGLGEDAQVSIVLAPISIGLLGRRELGGRALWLGIAGVVAPYRSESRIGSDVATRGVSVLPPGLSIIGGLGQRFGGGEVMLEIRGTTLTSPGGGLTYQGPVGGLAAVLGYRLIY